MDKRQSDELAEKVVLLEQALTQVEKTVLEVRNFLSKLKKRVVFLKDSEQKTPNIGSLGQPRNFDNLVSNDGMVAKHAEVIEGSIGKSQYQKSITNFQSAKSSESIDDTEEENYIE